MTLTAIRHTLSALAAAALDILKLDPRYRKRRKLKCELFGRERTKRTKMKLYDG